jgi:phospholipid transport system substrate-binding protein
LATLVSAPIAFASEARQTVEILHAALLESMKGGAQLGFEGRREQLAPVLDEVFDFRTISRLVTGRHWAGMSETQQGEFVGVFAQLSASTYAENFDEFGGQKFETRTSEKKKNAEVVRTVLLSPDGDEVSLNYLLARHGEEWRIVNVIAEGVSDISLKRTEYAAVIGQEGVGGLIAKLRAKVASYGSKAP